MKKRIESVTPLYFLFFLSFLMVSGCASAPSRPTKTPRPADQTLTAPRSAPPAQAPTTTYVEPGTGIVFPEKLGNLVRSGDVFINYGPVGGIQIRYSGPKVSSADIYVYSHGLTGVPDIVNHPEVVAKHFEACKNGILSMKEYRAVLLADGLTRFSESCRLPEVRMSCFAMRFHGSESISYLYLASYKGHFLKIRYTFPKTTEGLSKDAMNAFLVDFAKLLDGCN